MLIKIYLKKVANRNVIYLKILLFIERFFKILIFFNIKIICYYNIVSKKLNRKKIYNKIIKFYIKFKIKFLFKNFIYYTSYKYKN